MFLRFTLPVSEFDAEEFSIEAVFNFTEEIWGRQVEVFEPVAEVRHGETVTITFGDGSTIADPSWEDWGVVAELPAYVLANGEPNEVKWPSPAEQKQWEAEVVSGRIRTLRDIDV